MAFDMEISYNPGARPINGISIEFEMRSKFGVLQFKIYLSDHNEILHTSQVTLSWHVQNFIVIGSLHFKTEHCIFLMNFEFDRNIVSGMGARPQEMEVNIMAPDALAPCVKVLQQPWYWLWHEDAPCLPWENPAQESSHWWVRVHMT